MDVVRFLDRLRARPDYAGQIEHVAVLPAREGRFARPARPLPEVLAARLAECGIDRLYTHQVEALEEARADRDWIVVSGTASGKTLSYHLPIIEAVLADPEARALYLFPTKALAQDQLRGLLELLGDVSPDGAPGDALRQRVIPGVYDGDTPTAQRRRIKAEARLVLSNPDMLHASLLPYHAKWARFFSALRYVVLDEVHQYRGILGANVALVLRRLMRICEHYASRPVFLCASATIANPGELAARLVGRPVSVIADDGAPRGRKFFALWNPAPDDRDGLARRSAGDDAVELLVAALEDDAQVLAFTRTRQAAELIERYARQRLEQHASPAARRVRAYRGGYLPEERRAIERGLFSGELKAVATTNALELGIDVGSLDVALLVGYPGTIASTWQQAGRSGRRQGDSLAVLVAGNDPVDQYLLRHPHFLFGQSPEQAVVDPENPYVLANHLRSAAFELPLDAVDHDRFGPVAAPLAALLADEGSLTAVDDRYYFAAGQNPAARINLRHMSDNTVSIVLERGAARGGRPLAGPEAPGTASRTSAAGERSQVIAQVDAISAPELVYPEAVYLHHGESYLVRELDLVGKVAYVERREIDYYTQAVLESRVRIVGTRQTSEALSAAELAYGDLDVAWQTVAFKKIKFHTRENLGLGPVDIPAQSLATTGMWLVPGDAIRRQMRGAGLRTSEGLCGLRNLAIVALPIVAMCDSRDVSGVVDSGNLGRSAVVLYDRYPGGLGYCERGFRLIADLVALCLEIVRDCPCDEGCPRCVGLPNLRPAIHSDPDLTRGYPIPNKAATRLLAQGLADELGCAREPRAIEVDG